ncbi:MAG: glycosyltransferase [Flavobacteriales bacterium]
MKNPEPVFSFVIPVYESELTLTALVTRLNQFSKNEPDFPFHVIFIDDASSDKSLETLQVLNKQFSNEIHSFNQNQGQFTATAYGLSLVKSKLAITIDDDLQHQPEDALKLIEQHKQTGANLIYGSLDTKKHPLFRRIGAFILKRLLRISGANYEGVSSFRLLDRSILGHFEQLDRQVIFLDFELMQIAPQVAFTTVIHQHREESTSSYSTKKLLQLSLKMLFVHTGAPLKWISRLGLTIAFICFGFGIYFLIQKIYFDVPIGYTSLIVSTLFSSGLVLFSLGIIGEYIRKIWLRSAQVKTIYARKIEVEDV